jgi:ABC-2 type transport system permease protein
MRQLFVLLKYGLSTNYRRRSGRSGRLPSSVVTIAASLLIGLPLGSIFFQVFKVISSFRIDSCDPSTLLMLQWTSLNGLLFLASFVPSLINSFSRNEEIHLLLTFPVKRWTIVAYQMILTLSLQPFAVMMYLFVFPAYVVTHGRNLFLGLIVAFLFVLFMLSFSVLLSCIFGLFMSRSVARRITTISLIASVTLFFLATQFLPNYAQGLFTQDPAVLSSTLLKFMHPLNIFAWPIRALDEPIYGLLMLILVFSLSLLSSPVAERLSFEQVSFVGRSKTAGFKGGKMFWKDVKLMVRSEQGLFTLIYPAAFAVLFGLSLRSPVPALVISLVLSGTYVAYNSAMLTKQELSVWPLPLVFPLRNVDILLPKLFVPSLIYWALFSALLVFFKFWFSMSTVVFLLVPMVFVMFVFASTLGMFFYLRQASKVDLSNPSRVLNLTKTMIIQGLLLVIALVHLLPLLPSVQLALLDFIKIRSIVSLILYGAPAGCALALIFFSKRLFARVKGLFQGIE